MLNLSFRLPGERLVFGYPDPSTGAASAVQLPMFEHPFAWRAESRVTTLHPGHVFGKRTGPPSVSLGAGTDSNYAYWAGL